MNKRNLLATVAAITTAALIAATPAIAQDDEGGPQTWGDDAVYTQVVFVDYKSGQRGRAFEIIEEYFAKAGAASGTPGPRVFHFQTGSWDAAFSWDLAGGTKDLEWFRSPDNIKWWAAMVELTGSEEKAAAIRAEYMGTIARSDIMLGHYHPGASE